MGIFAIKIGENNAKFIQILNFNVSFRTEDDGEETLEVLEDGILKSRLINGHPVGMPV